MSIGREIEELEKKLISFSRLYPDSGDAVVSVLEDHNTLEAEPSNLFDRFKSSPESFIRNFGTYQLTLG